MKNKIEQETKKLQQNSNPLGKEAQIEVLKQSRIKKYIIPIILGVAMFCLVFFTRNPFKAETTEDAFKFLCDAATVPAILLFCFWGLAFSSSQGTFDGLVFAFKNVIGVFIPVAALQKEKSYKDFKEAKESSRKKASKEYLVVSGCFFILVLIFYVIYKIV